MQQQMFDVGDYLFASHVVQNRLMGFLRGGDAGDGKCPELSWPHSNGRPFPRL